MDGNSESDVRFQRICLFFTTTLAVVTPISPKLLLFCEASELNLWRICSNSCRWRWDAGNRMDEWIHTYTYKYIYIYVYAHSIYSHILCCPPLKILKRDHVKRNVHFPTINIHRICLFAEGVKCVCIYIYTFPYASVGWYKSNQKTFILVWIHAQR